MIAMPGLEMNAATYLLLGACLAALAVTETTAQVLSVEKLPSRPPCVEKQADVAAAWAQPAVALESGHDADDARVHSLTLSQPNKLNLVTAASAHFPVPPGGAGQPAQYMYVGLAALRIPKDGTYRIMTNEAMRIDVVRDGKLVDARAFGHGCLGKFVDFALAAGDALLELAGAPYDSVSVVILPRP
jgi:hypothetical protein